MLPNAISNQPLRVLEHSIGIAGAYCGWLLKQLGAEVFRLPTPSEGAAGAEARAMAYFTAGKRPWQSPTNRLAQHVGAFDLLITDCSPETEAMLGASLQSLHTLHTNLIVGVTSIFGLTGPYAGVAATGLDAQAISGVSWVLGEPGRPPLSIPPGILEHQAGVHLADACLVALLARQLGGQGQLVDVALADILAVYVGVNSRFYVHHGLQWHRAGRRAFGSGGAYPFTILPCKDGEVCLVGRTREEWQRLIKAMGEPAWTALDRYRNLRAMGTSYPDEVDALIAPWLSQKTRDEIGQIADEANLTVAAVRRVDETVNVPQLKTRGFFRPTGDANGKVVGPSLPFKASEQRDPTSVSINDELLAGARGSAPERGPYDPTRPLNGIRILDLGWVWSAPWATGLLAELGAEVIKIEHPGRLDNSRMSGRVYKNGAIVEGPNLEIAPFFHQINHGKLGITLDLKDAGAIEVLKSLVKISDVVIENMTAGAIERAGLGWNVLQEINPKLVMLSMTGAGQFGPQAGMRSYAPLMSSYVGLDALIGYAGEDPVGCVAFGIGDPNATSHGLLALLSGLVRRNATGRGCFIDLSQTESLLATLTPYLLQTQSSGEVVEPMGNGSQVMAPHGIFPAAGNDRWLSIVVQTDAQWTALTGLAAGEPWTADAQFATMEGRLTQRAQLVSDIARWSGRQERDSLVARLRGVGVPASPVLSLQEQSVDSHFSHRALCHTVSLPFYGSEPLYRAPWRFSAMDPTIERCGPSMGEHNEQIFNGLLGLPRKRIDELLKTGTAH